MNLPLNPSLTTTAVTGTITNGDTSVTLAVSPSSVTEDGTTNLVYTFTRTGVTNNALTVNYGIGGTATLNKDYTQIGAVFEDIRFSGPDFRSGATTFVAGATTVTLTIYPTADTTVESDETVALTLASGAGYISGTTTAVTGTIINDDDNLATAWTKLLGGSNYDQATALTTGSDGAIYISGYTRSNLDGQTNNGDFDAFITKYLADGTKSWTKLLGDSSIDYATALTTGSDGAIYVSGHTESNLDGETNNGGVDAFITKYLPDGTKSWTKLLGGSNDDYTAALTTGSDGAIYISGYTESNLDGETNNGGVDAFITKYLPDGTKSWTKLLGGSDYDSATALTTGSDGAIYISGYTDSNLDGQTNNGGYSDAFITKYLADGTKSWTNLLGGSDYDSASDLTTGSDGAIYVSGSTYGNLDGQTNNGGVDAFITKYLPDGTKSWTNLLGGSSTDIASALTTGSNGAIYVSGFTESDLDGQTNNGGYSDAFITRLVDDTVPIITLVVSPSSVTEDGTTNLVYTFTRTGVTTEALTVNYSIAGTADSSDYTGATPGIGKTIIFAAGATTATLTIDPTADTNTTVESDETVALTLATGIGYNIGTTTAVTGTITNDDTSVTLALSPSSVTEDGTTNLVYTFTRTGVTTNALTVNYNIGGTATFNTDYTQIGAVSYTGTTGTITFAAGATTATLTIDPTADITVESDETVALTLATGTGYTISTTTAVTGSIINITDYNQGYIQTILATDTGYYDNEGVHSPSNTNYIVGNPRYSITRNWMAFDLPLSFFPVVSAQLKINTYQYSSIDASETYELRDVITPVTTLVAGGSGLTSIYNDLGDGAIYGSYILTRADKNTTVTIDLNSSLLNNLNAKSGQAFALGGWLPTLNIGKYVFGSSGGGNPGANVQLVLNYSPSTLPTITLAVSSSSVTENGTTNLIYTFTRTGVIINALTVNYSIAGTADSSDYTGATPGIGKTIIFAAGATTATLTIDPTADTTVESDETVALTLATGTGYTIGTTTPVTGTIINDDTSVTLAVSPSSVLENGTTNLVYTFTRTGVLTNALTVNYNVGGTATFNNDYTQICAASYTDTTGTITFWAGATTAILTIDPKADTTVESDETVALTLATGTGYTIDTTTPVIGTIINDDTSVTLAVSPSSVLEDETTNLVYTFTRTGVTTNALTVNYKVSGTATLNNDYTQIGAASYTATTGTITFAAGATTATLTIDPKADTTVESDETVALKLATAHIPHPGVSHSIIT